MSAGWQSQEEAVTETIRMGVVGCGRGAGLLGIGVDGFEGVTAAALCDRNPERLEEAGTRFSRAERYTDFDEMLQKAELDALIVGTPATHHAEFCTRALDRNIHVLSEIPCVSSTEEAQ